MSCLSAGTSLSTLTPGTDNGGIVAGDILWHHSFEYKSHGKGKYKITKE